MPSSARCTGCRCPPGQRQRKEKQFNATTTPTASAPSATGRQSQESQKGVACPKARQNRRLHRSADSRQRGGTKVPERAKRFSLWTVRLRSRWRLCRLRMRHTPCGYGPFLFWQDKREMGGASCMDNAPCGSRDPGANLRRPIQSYSLEIPNPTEPATK